MSARTERQNTGSLVTTVKDAANRPTVAILVDGLDSRFTTNRESRSPESILNFAKVAGTVVRAAVFTQKFSNVDPEWEDNGFDVITKKDGKTSTKISIPLIVEAVATATIRPYIRVLIIAAPDCTVYKTLFSELCAFGVTTVAVNMDSSANLINSRNPLVTYTTMDTLNSLPQNGEMSVKQDLSDYDFSEFIELLAASEEKMPFVGVRFFINKVMWRLGGNDVQVSQEIFHQAEELGIVELYKSANINTDAPEVSACRLNRENQLVIDALETTTQSEPEEEVSFQYQDEEDETSAVAVKAGKIVYGTTNNEDIVDKATTLPTQTEDRPSS